MDPDETLARARRAAGNGPEGDEAAAGHYGDLDEWVSREDLLPEAWGGDRRPLLTEAERDLVQQLRAGEVPTMALARYVGRTG
jgi:hypothetical protein